MKNYSWMIAATSCALLATTAAQAAVIVVNTRADLVAPADGRCSLREAITAANLNVASGGAAGECAAGSVAPTQDRIGFSVRGRFRPTAANGQLPPLTEGYTTIDGWSAPAAVPGGKPRIELDGSLLAPPFEIGVYLASPFNIVRGLAIGNFTDFGVYVDGGSAHHNWIVDNRIGTNRTGRRARPNGVGVVIQFGAHDNLVGTNGDGVQDSVEGNLVSGNLTGMSVGDYGNRIAGNRVGTDAGGSNALANTFDGIITQVVSAGLVIGTDGDGSPGDAVEGNLVSGNLVHGIVVGGTGSHIVAGNVIGLDATGTFALPNLYGIEVAADTSAVRFGTDGDGVSDDFERNVISGNTWGLVLSGSDHSVAGNYVGTDVTGMLAVPNNNGISAPLDASLANGGTVIGGIDERFRNVISGNTSIGVDVGALDVTVECNFIGTDASGTGSVANGSGVVVFSIATNAAVRSNRISFNSSGANVHTSTMLFEDNVVAGNGLGLNWDQVGPTFVAENNWWGDPSGPTHAGNPAGLGDSISVQPMGLIDYDPWLVVEPVLCAP